MIICMIILRSFAVIRWVTRRYGNSQVPLPGGSKSKDFSRVEYGDDARNVYRQTVTYPLTPPSPSGGEGARMAGKGVNLRRITKRVSLP